MKNRFKGVFCAVMLLALLLQMPLAAFAEGTQEAPGAAAPVWHEPARLGREGLATLPNSAALLHAYDRLAEGVAACKADIEIGSRAGTLTQEDVVTVVDAYRRDYAEHFWFGSAYSMTGTKKSITHISPTYTLTGDALEHARLALENAIGAFLTGLDASMSEFERELVLHDRLAAHVTYTLDAPHAHDAYGALVQGAAVCEGYAEALQVLLRRAGIASVLAFGSSVNPATGQPENHAWNVVSIDGAYYHVDLTWDDQETNTYHAYFNQSDAVMAEDHVTDPTLWAFPVCTSTDALYFNVKGGVLNGYSIAPVGAILAENDLCASVYLADDGKEFIQWYMENASEIASAAGVRGSFKYGYRHIGHEWVIYIDACLHKTLTYVPETPVACESDGNRAYYTCTCGKWFEDAAAEREIVDHATVIRRALGHLYTERIADEAHLCARAADCTARDTYFLTCSKCGEISNERVFEGEKGAHAAPPVLVPAVSASCHGAGKEAYYVCVCGDCFRDAEGLHPIADIDSYGVIAKTPHTDSDDDGACDECGVDVAWANVFGGAPMLIIGGGALLLVLLLVLLLRKKR